MSISVTVRMYQVGELGDCFLLKFKDGEQESRVLIDCGSFRNGGKSVARLKKIVQHIKADLKGAPLDVVVGTHQHNDHLSGFVHAESEFAGMVEQVWLSWLDDPSESLATRIYNEQKALLGKLKRMSDYGKQLGLSGTLQPLSDVLGFYGIDDSGDPIIPATAVKNLRKMGRKSVDYLSPGEVKSVPGLEKHAVKVYVMGPPRKRKQLLDKDPGKDETYDPHFSLSLVSMNASKMVSALAGRLPDVESRHEDQFPFNQVFKKKESEIDEGMRKRYRHSAEKWRQIDEDWLEEANQLALYLDSFTNNSSLVLAFELVKSGKVLLFAADAQTGNWQSWFDIDWDGKGKGRKTKSLLENTVLYKVGHHGSHNATLVQGLEAMKHEELVAMIPVDRTDGNITKKNGWKMPAHNLYERLKEKTKYRVMCMDTGYADGCDPVKNKRQAKWSELPKKVKIDNKGQYIEYNIVG